MASNLTDVEHATEEISPKSGNDEHGNDGETNEGIHLILQEGNGLGSTVCKHLFIHTGGKRTD